MCNFVITKWTKNVIDNHKDKIVCKKPKGFDHKFRLLDDDGFIYAYGYSKSNSSFHPLDTYEGNYGCTQIQYKNKNTGEYETL